MSQPSPQARLIALINAANVKQWQAGQLEFGAPVVVTEGEKNTSVEVSAIEGLPYTGTQTLTYNRVSLAEAPGAASTEFLIGAQATTRDLVAEAAAAWGVDLSASDIVDAPLPEADEFGTITVTLEAASGSYLWTGSIEVTLVPETEALADVIPNTELDGLNIEDLQTGA